MSTKNPLPKPVTARQIIGFADPSVKTGFENRPEKFTMSGGATYMLKILSHVVEYFGARVENTFDPNKSYFEISRADINDIKAAQAGDHEALQRCVRDCPLFEAGLGDEVKPRYCVLVAVLGKVGANNKLAPDGRVMPWGFGGTTYQAIGGALAVLNPPLKSHALATFRVQCTDEKYQKCNINASADPDQEALKEIVLKNQDAFVNPKQPFAGSPIIDAFIAPEAASKVRQSLARARGTGGDAGGLARGGGGTPPGQGDGDIGDLVDSKPAPVQRQPAATGKPPAKAGGRPAAKPAPAPEPEPEGDSPLADDAGLGGGDDGDLIL